MATLPASQRKKDGGKIPGPANVPQVIEVACIFTLPNNKLARNVFHGAYTTAPPNMQTLAGALFTSLSSAWGTNLGAHMSPNTSFQRVEIRDMTSHTNPVFIGTGTAVPGTGANPAAPPENAIVLTENIAARGKGLKGRAYLGGWVAAAALANGTIDPAIQTAVNAFGTAVFNALTSNALTPCVAQVARQQYTGLTGTVIPQRGATHVNVASYTCRDLNWDSQRRRGQL